MDVGTRDLVLRVGGVDFSAVTQRAVLRSVPSASTFVSFADAQAGGKRDYHLAITIHQNLAAGSLWRTVWALRGTDVAFDLWPYGRPAGGIATTAQPRAVGTATVAEPDGDLLGGEPDDDPQAVMTVEVEWLCTAKPTLDPA